MQPSIARTVKTFPKGSVIIQEGSAATTEIFFLYRGTCQAEVGAQVVGTIEHGEFFGEVAAMLQSHRSATVRAATECTVFVFQGLDDQNLYEVLSNDPKILRRFSEQMALRLVEVSRRAAQQAEQGAAELKKLRKTISGAIYAAEKIRGEDALLRDLVEFLKGSSGIHEGRREDVDDRYFAGSRAHLEG